MDKKKLFVGTFFLSFSVLIYELVLIRFFSVIFSANIQFLAISIALFGMTLGGIIVYFLPHYFTAETLNKHLKNFGFLYGFAVFLFITIINFAQPLLQPALYALYNSPLVPIEGSIEPIIKTLFLIFILASIPFCLANICLSLLFKIKSQIINKLYFFDLIGAGLGVIVAIFLMHYFSAINVILISAAFGFLSAFIYNLINKKLVLNLVFLIIIIFCSVIIILNKNDQLIPMKIIYSKLKPNVDILFSKWNSFSNITVVQEEKDYLQIRIDAAAATQVYKFDGDFEKVKYLNNRVTSMAYQISEPGKSLIIGPGGGQDVLMALMSGHKVLGVDINPIIINDLMKNKYKDYSGNLYGQDNVEIIVAEGRSFVHNDKNKYNIISIPLVDTWASTAAGNLALVENYLYTVEAMEDMLNHLEPNGMLSIARWPIEGLRLLPNYYEAGKKLGLNDLEKNIIIVENNEYLINFLFKITPFTEQEITAIKELAAKNDLSLLYTPEGSKYENNYYNFLVTSDKDSFIKNFSYNIWPVYDNNPFFFFLTPWQKLTKNFYILDSGFGRTFIIVTILAFLSIVFPLFFKFNYAQFKGNLKSSFVYLGYFSCLGMAFILIEMIFIQKFILYLERPIYSYSVVLAALLFFAGLGSLLSNKINSSKLSNFMKISFCLICLIVLSIFITNALLTQTIGWPIIYKIFIAILFTAPVSMLMGMMLPLAIRRLNFYNLDFLIPWCWAVNGAMSIFATVFAYLLAIFWGFNFVFVLSALIYLVAFLLIALSFKDFNKIKVNT